VRPRKFDDAQAIEAYRSTWSTKRAAELLGVTHRAVGQRLDLLGYPRRGRRPSEEGPAVETYQQKRARRARVAKHQASHRSKMTAAGRCINEYGEAHAEPLINPRTGERYRRCESCRAVHKESR